MESSYYVDSIYIPLQKWDFTRITTENKICFVELNHGEPRTQLRTRRHSTIGSGKGEKKSDLPAWDHPPQITLETNQTAINWRWVPSKTLDTDRTHLPQVSDQLSDLMLFYGNHKDRGSEVAHETHVAATWRYKEGEPDSGTAWENSPESGYKYNFCRRPMLQTKAKSSDGNCSSPLVLGDIMLAV